MINETHWLKAIPTNQSTDQPAMIAWPTNVPTEQQTDWHADKLIKQSNVTNRTGTSAGKIYLNKLKSVLDIKIPYGVESFSFFNAA